MKGKVTNVLYTPDNEARIARMVDHAVDLVYPIFQEHGWRWVNVQPTRQRIEDEIYELIDACIRIMERDGSRYATSSFGRLAVRLYTEEPGLYEVNVYLNLGYECVSDE